METLVHHARYTLPPKKKSIRPAADHERGVIIEMGNTYKGWKNRQTWTVNFWIHNTEDGYKYWMESAKLADSIETLAYNLRTLHESESTAFGTSVYSDLLGHALKCVDWDEIARYLFEEAGRGEA